MKVPSCSLRRACHILLGVPETEAMVGDPLGYRPSQSLELRLVISLITLCTQAVRGVKPLQGKMAPYLKIIPFRNIISSSEANFIFLYLSSLLSFFFAFLCFASTVSTNRLPVIRQFHICTDQPQRQWCKGDIYKLLCSRLTARVSSCLKSPSELKY